MRYDRRAFICRVLSAAAAITLVPLRSLMAQDGKMIGNLSGFPEGEPVLVKEGNLIVVRNGDAVTVLSAKCTHRGCIVKPAKDKTLSCPCHGAQFSAAGDVLSGPAKKPLPRFETSVNDAGEVLVTI